MAKFLKIQPRRELSFHHKKNRQVSSSIRLMNWTKEPVAFQVMIGSNSPQKYDTGLKYGIISPGSACDFKVYMQCGSSVPEDGQSEDKFRICSGLLYSPATTTEELRTPEMFDKKVHHVQVEELRVVYTFPPRRSEAQNSSFTLQQRDTNDPQLVAQALDSHESGFADLLWEFIAVAVFFLFFWFFWWLIVKINVALIWAFAIAMTKLVVDVVWDLVLDSVKDWIKSRVGDNWIRKSLADVSRYFIKCLFAALLRLIRRVIRHINWRRLCE